MFSQINSATLNGLKALAIKVEVNANFVGNNVSGETLFMMVGLPDNAVRESRQRVQSAVANSSLRLPRMNITANFAPADIRKEGSGLDLPLAVALLKCAKLIKTEDLSKYMFVGELGLDGTVRPVRGALPIAIEARRLGFDSLFVPEDNVREASVVNNLKVFGVSTLIQLVDHLNGQIQLEQTISDTRKDFYAAQTEEQPDFSEVKGQELAKRAFEVAAAGGHNLIMVGSPGCGKSMMAKRLPGILPPLTLAESLETTQIYSIAGKMGRNSSLIAQRPFRSPHHTISDVALIGGGTNLQPGEISLAHNGVLFLDELPEYSRAALETMRQPLEDRQITISRAKYNATLPCSFMLVAAMNPCPCGYYGDPTHECHCTPGQIQRYMSKISGPLLDRIDMQLELTPVPLSEMQNAPRGETSAEIRKRVVRAREIQQQRYKNFPGIHCNAQMTDKMLQEYAQLDAESLSMLRVVMQTRGLSARSYNRILKVARTIADLAASERIESSHIAEAIGYRNLDRSDWAERGR